MFKLLTNTRPYSTTLRNTSSKKVANKWLWGGALATVSTLLYHNYNQNNNGKTGENFTIMPKQTYINVNDNIKQFPKYFYSKDAVSADNEPIESSEPSFDGNFILLGTGTRSLPISYFKVYSIGIYLDMLKRNNILATRQGQAESTEEMINDIIESHTPIIIKMTPLMNSNLTFIRETGLIKSIKNSVILKDDQTRLEKCVDDIRQAYNYKHSLGINDDLYMQFSEDQSVQFYYFNNKSKELVKMGKTTDPLVNKILLKTYLEGDTAMVPDAKKMFVDNLLN